MRMEGGWHLGRGRGERRVSKNRLRRKDEILGEGAAEVN